MQYGIKINQKRKISNKASALTDGEVMYSATINKPPNKHRNPWVGWIQTNIS